MGTVRTLLRLLYRCWLGLARGLGRVNTVLLLGVSFYLLVLPIGWCRRRLMKGRPSGWVKKEALPRNHFRKQF